MLGCFKESESLVSSWNNGLLIAKPAFTSLKLSGRCREDIFFNSVTQLIYLNNYLIGSQETY